MAYTTVEGRQKVLDDLALATEQVGDALAALGEAYEHLDEHNGDVLDQALFRPVRLAYGTAKRTHAQFALRSSLPGRDFPAGSSGPESQSVRALIDRAVAAAGEADQAIAELQDSMLPVEVGDPELRAGLAQVREALDPVPTRARELVRTVGR
jgi:hypothetical protein